MTRAWRTVRGFTLLEVLMAVVVLAIGLLGLGAVLPRIIQLQRDGSDQTFGLAGVRNAEAWLTSVENVDASYYYLWAVADGVNVRPVSSIPSDGTWYVAPVDRALGTSSVGQSLEIRVTDSQTGTTTWVDAQDPLPLAMAERLIPPDASGAASPQFVWDVAVRRLGVRTATYVDPRVADVEIAIFLRRIDPRIRLEAGDSLYELLTVASGGGGGVEAFAVSEDDRGRPTLNGSTAGGYSRPIQVPVIFAPAPATGGGSGAPPLRDRLVIAGGNGDQVNRETAFALASQPGQILLDNLGQQHTVIGPDDRVRDEAFDIRLSAAMPTGVQATTGDATVPSPRVVVFTAQVPVAVKQIRVSP